MIVRKSASSRASGFSLVENIIGMVVIGIMVVALYAALTSGFNVEKLNREDLRATQLLIEKMDQLRVISWDQLLDPTIVPRTFQATFNPDETVALRTRPHDMPSASTNGLAKKASGASIVYSGSLSITDPVNDTVGYTNEIKVVTVSLDWKSATGRPRSRSFTTYIARYGMQNYRY
jgi:prepilin-type N-terminal cleavage/methylation domain-containing protein